MIGAVEDDVVAGDDVTGVLGGEMCVVGVIGDGWVESGGVRVSQVVRIVTAVAGLVELTHPLRYATALCTLCIPTRLVECAICLWRLDTSTLSPSTRPSSLTPAPAM